MADSAPAQRGGFKQGFGGGSGERGGRGGIFKKIKKFNTF
jgi:hypothetical protein